MTGMRQYRTSMRPWREKQRDRNEWRGWWKGPKGMKTVINVSNYFVTTAEVKEAEELKRTANGHQVKFELNYSSNSVKQFM